MADGPSDTNAREAVPPAATGGPAALPHAGLGVLALVISLLGVLAVTYLKAMAPLLSWKVETGHVSAGVAAAAKAANLCAAYGGWLLLIGGLIGLAGLFQHRRRRVLAAIAIIPGIPVMVKSGAALVSRPFYIVVLYAAIALAPLAIAVYVLNARAAREADSPGQRQP